MEERIGPLLLRANLKLVAAESLTGGLLGHRITNVPGASGYYLGSITAYATEAKERLLNVSHATLVEFGAVSRETAGEMAYGARAALAGEFPLDQVIGISLTGIAGPDGGTPEKPVGLVWIGLSAARGDFAWLHCWYGTRMQNKQWSARAALRHILHYLEKDLAGNACHRRSNGT